MKVQLLRLIDNEDHEKAIESVLSSGLLPKSLLQQWLERTVERAIRLSLGNSGCPEWETWAFNWLSGEDRTEETASEVEYITQSIQAAAWAAAAAAWAGDLAIKWGSWDDEEVIEHISESLWCAGAAAEWDKSGEQEERKQQYQDLLNLIKEMKDENN